MLVFKQSIPNFIASFLDGLEGFSGGSDGKTKQRRPGFDPWVGKIVWRHGNPLQYSCLENFHGQRSLAGYSPWDSKESVMTE